MPWSSDLRDLIFTLENRIAQWVSGAGLISYDPITDLGEATAVGASTLKFSSPLRKTKSPNSLTNDA
jgi:hypothetical protein